MPLAPLIFISAFLDIGLGIGFGAFLTSLLFLRGHSVTDILSAFLLLQILVNGLACFFHHRLGNVDLRFSSRDFKLSVLLGFFGSVGILLFATESFIYFQKLLVFYTGYLILIIGILIIATLKKQKFYSASRILLLCLPCLLNRKIPGGGMGPLVVGGQVLSGVRPKPAVGITLFTKLIASVFGLGIFLLKGNVVNWNLFLYMASYSLPAVILAPLAVKKISSESLKLYIGLMLVLLGATTLLLRVLRLPPIPLF